MSSIPDVMVVLDEGLSVVRRLARVPITDKLERDYDRMLVEHVDIVEDALRQAELLDPDSSLVVLCTQFQQIDVLLAEVDERRELRRLVVVENKLFRNPESRRQVLGQILDYGDRLRSVDAQVLIDASNKDAQGVFERGREQLARILRSGDFLLLICGDRIQANLVRLMEPFMDRARHATSGFTMGLLSLALYRDEAAGQLLLVPNVVGAIERGERALSLTVTVRDGQGREVAAQVVSEPAEARNTARGSTRWDEETFFERVRSCNHDEDWADPEPGLRKLVELLRKEGLEVRWNDAKTAGFGVRVPGDKITVMHVYESGQVHFSEEKLAGVLGATAVTTKIDGLGKLLNIEFQRQSKSVYLGDSFNLSDPTHFRGLVGVLLDFASAIRSGG